MKHINTTTLVGRVAGCLIVLAVADSANASPWEFTGSGGKSAAFALDRGTITRGPVTKAWFLAYYANTPRGEVYMMQQEAFDCPGHQNKTEYSIVYNMNGEVVKSYHNGGQWEPVAPDTIVAHMLKSVCSTSINPDDALPFDDMSSQLRVDYLKGKLSD